MMTSSRWFGSFAAIALMAAPAVADSGVAAGKVKEIDPAKQQFVLTDSAGKDWTIRLDDAVIINRGGKEGRSDLKAGDPVNVCYRKGAFQWTAHYILVQEGDTKDATLVHGAVKGYDADKNRVTFTDPQGKDWTFPLGDAKVRLNREPVKIGDVKIGDHALALVEKVGDVSTLRSLMIERK
jgi:hypothetical protein